MDVLGGPATLMEAELHCFGQVSCAECRTEISKLALEPSSGRRF
jgi:hypothetical protein